MSLLDKSLSSEYIKLLYEDSGNGLKRGDDQTFSTLTASYLLMVNSSDNTIVSSIINQSASEIVINDASADINTRIESNGDANMFFIDAGSNEIGIGTNNPGAKFHVKSGSGGGASPHSDDNMIIEDNGNAYINFITGTGDISGIIMSDDTRGRGGYLFAHNNGATERAYIFAGGYERLTILTSNGYTGIGTGTPVTFIEVEDADPYITLHNNTHENSDEGRECRLIARGEQSGGEETILGYLQFSHDATGDDERGQLQIYLNDGDDDTSPSILGMEILSTGIAKFPNKSSVCAGEDVSSGVAFSCQPVFTSDSGEIEAICSYTALKTANTITVTDYNAVEGTTITGNGAGIHTVENQRCFMTSGSVKPNSTVDYYYGIEAVPKTVGGYAKTTYGGYFSASKFMGTGTIDNAYGIYAAASGGGTSNWAGYFADGDVKSENDVYVAGDLGVGVTSMNNKAVVAGNLAIGNNPPAPTVGGTYVVVCGDNVGDPTMDTNTAGFYGKDVGGTVEAFAIDEADNAAQLTPHNFSLFTPDKDAEYPWSYYARNRYLGKEINVDMWGVVKAVEELVNKQFIYLNDIEKINWDVQQAKEKFEWEHRQLVEIMNEEVEINSKDALEYVYADEVVGDYGGTEKRFTINGNTGVVETIDKHIVNERLQRSKIKTWKPKENCRLDDKTGKFYRKKTKKEALIELKKKKFVKKKPPAWMKNKI